MTGPGVRLRNGWRAAAATALCVLATSSALGALTGVLAPGPWRWHAVLAVAGTGAVVAGARALTRSTWLPSAVGLVVALYGLVVLYTAPGTGLRLVPDLESVRHVRQLVEQAGQLIEVSVVPMPVWTPVELVVVGAAVVVLLAADLLAVGCAMPALTGVAFVAVWTPAVVIGYPGSTWALAGTGFAYLLLLALGQQHVTRTGAARRSATVLAGSAAVVALTLAAGPVVASVPAWSVLDLPDVGSGAVGPVRLSSDLDLRDSLRQQSEQTVVRYTIRAPGDADEDAPAVTASLVGPLRSFTLRSFDGRAWSRESDVPTGEWAPGTLLTSDPALLGAPPDASRGTLARVDLAVGALREDRLPVSTFPRTVDIDGPWRYDAARDEVVGTRRTDPSTRYSMVVEVPSLTPDLLRAAGDDYPDEARDYLDVPDTAHTDDLRELAEEVTAGAGTPYDQALALQTYFRDGTRFRYDTSVEAGTSDDAVWDFLQSRRGYCVQYATSMTVLARSLGIPARLGVGFLPGMLGSDGSYRITGADAHAWPELYFPGTGWVRFEPTPAIQTGPPPAWSNPYTAADATPSASAAAPTRAAQTPGPVATATAGTTTGGTVADDRGDRVPLLVLGVGVAVLAAAAGLWARRRRTDEVLTPELAWERLRDRLRRAGVTWSDAHTPRQAAAAVRDRVTAARGRPLGDEADRALGALAAAVEADRYAPPERIGRAADASGADVPADGSPGSGRPDGEVLQRWVGLVLTDVSAGGRREPDAGATPLAAQA